ncbi:MAG: chorismate synthase [Dysgonamonadaceae bacterium]|jgi:chorismate synthase|nr:chorismate synthase [Dysgonamonadaceae bacterium]
MNSLGNIFRLTSFGESHGKAIGGVIDGCPAGLAVDLDFIRGELDRRRPGQSELTTSRREADCVEFLSGIFEGRTLGTPIGFIVNNTDVSSGDYSNLRETYRPSHADYVYGRKYGIRDPFGGGRSSARETVARVVAGAFAKLALRELGVEIRAYTSQVGSIVLDRPYAELDLSLSESNPVRCPDPATAERMMAFIREVKSAGDTTGGVVSCVCMGIPVGLGEPVFGKLHAALGGAMLGLNAVKGFEYGMGFSGVGGRGSELNDAFYVTPEGKIRTRTNHSGGIQGGISNGEDIYFRVAFKPVATLLMPQQTVDIYGNETTLQATGRHDPCVLPRAVPLVEAMAAMVLLDYWLLSGAGASFSTRTLTR